MDIIQDAVAIDEVLMKNGVIGNYMISEIAIKHMEQNLDPLKIALKISQIVVRTCFDASQYSWKIYEASGLHARMGYYFRQNAAVPDFSKPVGRPANAVIRMSDGKIFKSAAFAAHAIGASTRSLYPHLRGDANYPTVGGHVFQWLDAEKRVPREVKAKRVVICLEDGHTYESPKRLASLINCALSSVYSVLNSGQSLGGYHYAWYTPGQPKPDLLPEADRKPGPREVVCIETGIRYSSARGLAGHINVRVDTIYAHLRGDPRYPKVQGHTYRYA